MVTNLEYDFKTTYSILCSVKQSKAKDLLGRISICTN